MAAFQIPHSPLYWRNEITTQLLSGFAASLLTLVPGTAVLSVCRVILEHLNVAMMKNDCFNCFFDS